MRRPTLTFFALGCFMTFISVSELGLTAEAIARHVGANTSAITRSIERLETGTNN